MMLRLGFNSQAIVVRLQVCPGQGPWLQTPKNNSR
jgi:hypothetical protein